MSIERRGPTTWRVRWLQGGQHRSKTFDRLSAAKEFQAEIQLLKSGGRLRSAPRQTLAAFAEDHWFPEVVAELAGTTQVFYRRAWDTHITPYLGERRIRDISTMAVRDLDRHLAHATGDAMRRKTLRVLSSCLGYAAEEGYITANPVMAVRQNARRGAGPRRAKPRPPRALAPSQIERIVVALRAGSPAGDRDALLVSLMAYAGLRPGDALALRPCDVEMNTIHVERAIALGEEKGTKTGAVRVTAALGGLSSMVADWSAERGLAPEAYLFGDPSGRPWSESAYRNWRRRVFQPAAEAAGLGRVRPYSLRHSWASLQLHSGRDAATTAKQAGHSVETFLRYYAHEIEEWSNRAPEDPDRVIAAARAEVAR